MKAELARDILNEENESVLVKVIDFFRVVRETTSEEVPWEMTLEERKERIRQSEKDYEAGLGISHEEFVKKGTTSATGAIPGVPRTIEELHAACDHAEEDYKNGRCITTEEMFNNHPEWS
jgi:hypothetical protein